jgi:hypothetical protein
MSGTGAITEPIVIRLSGETSTRRAAVLKSIESITPEDSGIADQFDTLLEALEIYSDRNGRYKDNWRRFGWRGCIFRIRERAERAWDDLFYAEVPEHIEDHKRWADAKVDDLVDLINFSCFAIRAIREGNRDGTWFRGEE